MATETSSFIKIPNNALAPAWSSSIFTLVVQIKYLGDYVFNMLWARSDDTANTFGLLYAVTNQPGYWRFGANGTYTNPGIFIHPATNSKEIFINSISFDDKFYAWNQTTSGTLSLSSGQKLYQSGESWNIGALTNGLYPLNAYIYSIRGYNRILSDSEINQLRVLP